MQPEVCNMKSIMMFDVACCYVCGKNGKTMKRCTRCRNVLYWYVFEELVSKTSCPLRHVTHQGFFSWGGDWGVPPIRRKFRQSPPPSHTCPRFWTKACPPPAEVRPRKFEKFKYIFVLNLTTFKLKSTFKSCISCLK